MSSTSSETSSPTPKPSPNERPWYRQPLFLGALAIGVIAFFFWREDTMNKVGTRHYLVGSDAPLFELPLHASSETFRLEDHDGKVILLDFWATWCVPCKRQVPALRTLNGRYASDGFAVIGVNTDEDNGSRGHKIHRYLTSAHFNIPVPLDDHRTQVLYDIQSIPTMILIGKDGKIKRVFRGLTTRSILERAIKQELRN